MITFCIVVPNSIEIYKLQTYELHWIAHSFRYFVDSFPTCQARIVKFSWSNFRRLLLRRVLLLFHCLNCKVQSGHHRTSTLNASSRSQWAPPQASDLSGHCQTLTWPYTKFAGRVGTTGPRPYSICQYISPATCQKICQIVCLSMPHMSDRMPQIERRNVCQTKHDRMSEVTCMSKWSHARQTARQHVILPHSMLEHMPERMLAPMSDKMSAPMSHEISKVCL